MILMVLLIALTLSEGGDDCSDGQWVGHVQHLEAENGHHLKGRTLESGEVKDGLEVRWDALAQSFSL